ncbi:DNA (cytosine-5-)-methyltransferase [Thalassospira xiamenensis]|nr:DNA (cytosine-5-)-methyltransferase [Thalassospira xiamenensis]
MNAYSEFFLHRAAARYTSAEAAKALGVTVTTLRSWENGRKEPPIGALCAMKSVAMSRGVFRPANDNPEFTFVDLFAGIGGLRQAFQEAGGECVFTSEWNRFSVETYVSNFGFGHPIKGDITIVDENEIPEHDILVAGFPCQPFSLAGVSKKNSLGRPHGFADETQGTLFFDVARIINAKQPKAFVLENVRDLKHHDRGRTMAIVLKTLRAAGYKNTRYQVMNGASWVPQNRERLVIVGTRDGEAFDFSRVCIPDKGPVLRTILHTPEVPQSWDSVYAPGGDVSKFTLSDKLWEFHRRHAAKHKASGNSFGYGLVTGNSVATRTLSARYYKDGSEILVSQSGKNPRRLTPRECARLMGFDRDGIAPFHIPVSNSQAWRQFGNSVVVPMFAAVAKSLVDHLRGQQVVAIAA